MYIRLLYDVMSLACKCWLINNKLLWMKLFRCVKNYNITLMMHCRTKFFIHWQKRSTLYLITETWFVSNKSCRAFWLYYNARINLMMNSIWIEITMQDNKKRQYVHHFEDVFIKLTFILRVTIAFSGKFRGKPPKIGILLKIRDIFRKNRDRVLAETSEVRCDLCLLIFCLKLELADWTDEFKLLKNWFNL